MAVAASKSFSSDISRFFTEWPTDKTMGPMIGGIAAVVVGLFGLLQGQLK